MAKGEEPIKLKAFHRNALQFFGITGGQRDGFPASTGLRSTLAFFGWGTRAPPRVLIAASRRNALRGKSSRWRGRHRQHARRVRSPPQDVAIAPFAQGRKSRRANTGPQK